jgi:hypothetical protein
MSSLTAAFNNVTAPLVAQCYNSGNNKPALVASLTDLQAAAAALSAALAAKIATLR